MKKYDDSKSGNDCYIYSFWYWLDDPDPCVINMVRATGYFSNGLETAVYIKPNDDMPDEVQRWFAK